MALDKVVDSSKLDGAMAATAEVIRWKTGSEDKIVWDEETGFREAVRAINGVGLQEKTVAPKHSEQVIVPDEQYDGLSSVKVLAVPRLPACVASAKVGADAEINIVSNLGILLTVTGEEFIHTHSLYDGYRLPILPEVDGHPYVCVMKNLNTSQYEAIYSASGFYFDEKNTVFQNSVLYDNNSVVNPRYVMDLDGDSWEYKDTAYAAWTEWSKNSSSTVRTILYTNRNITLESATATSIYKYASEPVATL